MAWQGRLQDLNDCSAKRLTYLHWQTDWLTVSAMQSKAIISHSCLEEFQVLIIKSTEFDYSSAAVYKFSLNLINWSEYKISHLRICFTETLKKKK